MSGGGSTAAEAGPVSGGGAAVAEAGSVHGGGATAAEVVPVGGGAATAAEAGPVGGGGAAAAEAAEAGSPMVPPTSIFVLVSQPSFFVLVPPSSGFTSTCSSLAFLFFSFSSALATYRQSCFTRSDVFEFESWVRARLVKFRGEQTRVSSNYCLWLTKVVERDPLLLVNPQAVPREHRALPRWKQGKF